MISKQTASFVTCLLFSGCAILHSTQVSDVDSQAVLKGRRFEILVSETGVNLQEAASIAKAFTRNSETNKTIQSIQDIVSLFQVGPRTGEMVFNDKYPDAIFPLIQKECPSGRASSLVSIRETNKYPVVSGEIVKLVGYCVN